MMTGLGLGSELVQWRRYDEDAAFVSGLCFLEVKA